MTNHEIAQVFRTLAVLMELHNDNPFKIKSYSTAAYRIEKHEQPLVEMAEAEIADIKGIGNAISGNVIELLKTGNIRYFEKLIKETPEGLLDMLNIQGLGPKKISAIWKELQVESVTDLLVACHENRLAALKGFGPKLQESVKQSLEFYLTNKERFLYAVAERDGELLIQHINETLPAAEVFFTGELRRKAQIVDQIELLLAATEKDIKKLIDDHQLEQKAGITGTLCGKTTSGIPFSIYYCPPDEFGWHLFITTGNESHVEQVKALFQTDANPEKSSTEIEIYKLAGLQYIEPELREAGKEIELAKQNRLPKLITIEDIKGVIHSHSTYSDGVNTLRDMAEYAKNNGFEYLVISDHSQSAFYAGGLKPEKIYEQHREIDKLNNELAPFRIFKSIESDILSDGSLDYEEEILQLFDCVIASIHSNMKMTEEKGTLRLIRAVENPFTTILGHMTGRLLLARDGYPVDHKKIIDACAANDVVIELNSNPYRLDMDWKWLDYALNKGVTIAINPDAHSTKGITDIKYGVHVARKGFLTPDRLLNNLGAADLERFFQDRKVKKNFYQSS